MILFLPTLNFLKYSFTLMQILIVYRHFYISLQAISNFFCDMVKIKVYQNQTSKDAGKRVLERIVYDNPSFATDISRANDVLRWLFGSDAIIQYEFSRDDT